MNRTVRLVLSPTPEQAQLLLETMRQFTQSFNAVCAQGWQLKQGNAYNLHRFTYHQCRALCPKLISDLHIQAREKAAEAVRSALALLKNQETNQPSRGKRERKVGCPSATLCPPRYNKHSFSLNWQTQIANLATVGKRQLIPFALPPYAKPYLDTPGTRIATADLMYHQGRFTLHVVLQLDDVEFVDNGTAVGVDLGLCRPAVTSNGRHHGQKRWREVSKRRFRLKRKLQANGSKSAKRHLRRLAGREQRFRRDCDHVLSKSILQDMAPGTSLVVETLTHIRTCVTARHGEAQRRLHAWSFAQFQAFLTYKAQTLGCRVVSVDAHHTSQRCSQCGHIARGNRASQSRFVCLCCGYRANADQNAACNIRDRSLVGWSSPSGGLLSESLLSPPSVSAVSVSWPENHSDGTRGTGCG